MVPSTDLSLLLLLYYRAHSADVYCDYMEGFRLLHTWLKPVETEWSIYCQSNFMVDRCFITYEMQRIAEITGVPLSSVFLTLLDLFGPKEGESRID